MLCAKFPRHSNKWPHLRSSRENTEVCTNCLTCNLKSQHLGSLESKRLCCQVNTLISVQGRSWTSSTLAIKCQGFQGSNWHREKNLGAGLLSTRNGRGGHPRGQRCSVQDERWGEGGNVRKDFAVEATPGGELAGPSGWRLSQTEGTECLPIEDRLKENMKCCPKMKSHRIMKSQSLNL